MAKGALVELGRRDATLRDGMRRDCLARWGGSVIIECQDWHSLKGENKFFFDYFFPT